MNISPLDLPDYNDLNHALLRVLWDEQFEGVDFQILDPDSEEAKTPGVSYLTFDRGAVRLRTMKRLTITGMHVKSEENPLVLDRSRDCVFIKFFLD